MEEALAMTPEKGGWDLANPAMDATWENFSWKVSDTNICAAYNFYHADRKLILYTWWVFPASGETKLCRVSDIVEDDLPKVYEFLADAGAVVVGRFRGPLKKAMAKQMHNTSPKTYSVNGDAEWNF